MKVKVVANELVDTDIEMVSLVRHGANRCPFKVLKSEDDAPATLGDKLQSFFSLGRGDFNVVAYFMREDAAEKILPLLKAEGIDVEQAVTKEGVVSITLSDAPSRGFLQLNDALAIAVDQPIREFSEESVVKAYAEGIGLTDFAPGVSLAVRGLADTVWSLLNSPDADEARDVRVAKVDSMLASFRKYITSLAKALPEQVFRVEAAARDVVKTEEHTMPQGKPLSEAVPGDLDGLSKSDAPAKGTEAPGEVKKEEAPAVAAAAQPSSQETPADPLASIMKALETIAAKVDGLAKSVEEQRSVTDTLAAQVAEAEELAKSATEKADSTTLVRKGEDIDLALSSLGGRDTAHGRTVRKSGEALWDGLFSDLDTFRPSR